MTYQNEQNGYSVIKCKAKGYNDIITVVGAMHEVHVGAVLTMTGEWKMDAKFGRQFSIAPGVMSFMSVWAKYLEVDFIGDALLAGKSTKIEWLKPVYAGDVLTGKAVITKLTWRNEKNGIVELSFEVYNQDGELVLTDITESIVKRQPETGT